MITSQGARSVSQLRREQRMKVLLSGELRVGGVTATCRIHDISRGGACVEWGEQVRPGQKVQFERAGIRASGIIAWVGVRRVGIRFDAPIRATDLLVQMSHSRQALAQPVVSAASVPFPST